MAQLIGAIQNCQRSGNTEWEEKHRAALFELVDDLPSGSGLDNGTRLHLEDSNRNRIVLFVEFHHMNDVGMYDGWTQHTITVVPSLGFDFELKISGRNRNDIKEHLEQLYRQALEAEVKV